MFVCMMPSMRWWGKKRKALYVFFKFCLRGLRVYFKVIKPIIYMLIDVKLLSQQKLDNGSLRCYVAFGYYHDVIHNNGSISLIAAFHVPM